MQSCTCSSGTWLNSGPRGGSPSRCWQGWGAPGAGYPASAARPDQLKTRPRPAAPSPRSIAILLSLLSLLSAPYRLRGYDDGF